MNRNRYPVTEMCRFFRVSRSGYYEFVKRLEQPAHDAALAEIIELIDNYIYFYNHQRIQLKNGVAPLTLRHSA